MECNLMTAFTCTLTTTLFKNCSRSKASFLQMGTRCQGFSFSAAWHSDKPLNCPFGETDPVVSFLVFLQLVW